MRATRLGEAVSFVRRSLVAARNARGELLWVAGGTILGVLGSFVGLRLLTGRVAPAEYGELALAMTAAQMANGLLFGPLSSGVGRFLAAASERGEMGPYLAACRRAFARTAVAFTVLSAVGSIVVAWKAPPGVRGLLTLGFVFALLSGYLSFLSALQNAARRRQDVAIFQALFQAGRYLAALALVVLLGGTSTVTLLGFVVCAAVLAFAQRRRLLAALGAPTSGAEQGRSWESQIEAYARPMIAWGAFAMLQASADRWALGFFTTTKQVGLYAVLFQLSFFPTGLVFGMLSQYVGPVLCERVGDGTDPERVRAVNRWINGAVAVMLAATVAVSAVTLVLHPLIFKIAVAETYRGASRWLPLGVLGAGLYGVGQFASVRGMVRPNTRTLLVPKIGSSIVGALCMVVGAWAGGIPGVLVGWLVFAVVHLAWMLAAA